MIFSLYRLYNKPHLDVNTVRPVASLHSNDLVKEFQTNEEKASLDYVDQVIEVSGTLVKISKSNEKQILVLGDVDAESSVICQFPGLETDELTKIRIGDQLVVKGLCTGYLMDVMLINCVIVISEP